VPRSYVRRRPSDQPASAPTERLAVHRRAALNELFANYEDRIRTRHYWGLRSIYEKRGLNSLTKEDCRVAIAAAAYYRNPTGAIPEYEDWCGADGAGRDGGRA
jgi:hypothetical protein